jgi:2-keto-4-pentenoate hydratase/2-oxohepta-3-ene-1,7-dioic acid hydratase in catechol pathway
VLVTRDEFPHPLRLPIILRLNGQVMQSSNTEQMVFSVERLVSYVSQVCTLKPGDLLYTGTPAGVGMARKPPVFLKPGDWLEVEIGPIGVLRNPVVAES